MAKTGSSKLGPAPNTKTVYIGAERYDKLSKVAIDVSYHGGRQITASQVMQFLVDTYTPQAKEKMLAELTKANAMT